MALLDWIVIGAFCCALVGIVLWVIYCGLFLRRTITQQTIS